MAKWAPGVEYRLVRAQDLSGKAFIPFYTDVLVVDEAHMYKNKTARSKNIESIVSKRIILATGTAFTNHPAEIWRLLELIGMDRFFGNSKSDFYKTFKLADLTEYYVAGGGGDTATAWKLKENVDMESLVELKKTLHKICYIRRDKKDCIELPELREEEVYLDTLTIKQKEKAGDTFEKWVNNEVSDDTVFSLRAKDAYSKVSNKEFKEYYHTSIDSIQGPVVVFAHHQKVIKKLIDLSSDYATGVLDGNSDQDERDALVASFQAGKLKVLICSIPVASTGITLTTSSNMIVVELPWTYADLDQMISRIYRRGQDNKSVVQNVMLKDSFDDRMYELIVSKKRHFQTVLQSENNIINNQGDQDEK
jgi:SWI/SNF-related matrix-associated actin-dependent regulator 1 of chromatin subfamily A